MPVAEFPGRFGWGYDGVDLFAPTRLYGTPDDFRRFVDRAHRARPRRHPRRRLQPPRARRQLPARSSPTTYFTDRYSNEWGEALNFDGADAGPVREFFVANAGYWIDEFHLDGLRLDATQAIYDASPTHILAEIAARARAAGRGPRTIVLVGRERAAGRPPGAARRAQAATASTRCGTTTSTTARMVALTGRSEAYYTDYRGTPQEFVSAAKCGLSLSGAALRLAEAARAARRRSTCAPARFVTFLQNHDQVANSGCGLRAARADQSRAATAR